MCYMKSATTCKGLLCVARPSPLSRKQRARGGHPRQGDRRPSDSCFARLKNVPTRLPGHSQPTPTSMTDSPSPAPGTPPSARRCMLEISHKSNKSPFPVPCRQRVGRGERNVAPVRQDTKRSRARKKASLRSLLHWPAPVLSLPRLRFLSFRPAAPVSSPPFILHAALRFVCLSLSLPLSTHLSRPIDTRASDILIADGTIETFERRARSRPLARTRSGCLCRPRPPPLPDLCVTQRTEDENTTTKCW